MTHSRHPAFKWYRFGLCVMKTVGGVACTKWEKSVPDRQTDRQTENNIPFSRGITLTNGTHFSSFLFLSVWRFVTFLLSTCTSCSAKSFDTNYQYCVITSSLSMTFWCFWVEEACEGAFTVMIFVRCLMSRSLTDLYVPWVGLDADWCKLPLNVISFKDQSADCWRHTRFREWICKMATCTSSGRLKIKIQGSSFFYKRTEEWQ